MFKREPIYIEKTRDVTREVKHTSQRQSTAEDAKLLSDLEKEALAKITDTICYSLHPLKIEAAVFQRSRDLHGLREKIAIIFCLNGEKIIHNFDIPEVDTWYAMSPIEKKQHAFDRVAKEITELLMKKFLTYMS